MARVGAFLNLLNRNPKIRFVVVHASVDFIKPTTLAQELTVSTWVSRIGRTSFTLEYEIKNHEGDLIAKGSTVQVTIDSEGRKKEISEVLKSHLRTLLVE
jgi:acyl-CoA thioester hydrolase